MRKQIKNERAKTVMPRASLDQVVGGMDDDAKLFEDDPNRYRTLRAAGVSG